MAVETAVKEKSWSGRTLTESDTRGSRREQLHLQSHLKCGDSPEETCGHTVCVLLSGVNLSEQIPTVPNIQAAADKNTELLMVSSPKPKVWKQQMLDNLSHEQTESIFNRDDTPSPAQHKFSRSAPEPDSSTDCADLQHHSLTAPGYYLMLLPDNQGDGEADLPVPSCGPGRRPINPLGPLSALRSGTGHLPGAAACRASGVPEASERLVSLTSPLSC